MIRGTQRKLFDPRDGSTGDRGSELLDATVVRRNGQWRLYLAGQTHGHGAPDIFSASLPSGAPLAAAGWQISRDRSGALMPLASRASSVLWDGAGGRHCPSYVKGWDPERREWVERIYYAGAPENLWGPYTIGFLEWEGQKWADQPMPAFTANEEWEHGSVFEPNLIWDDGKWKMWYAAGSNREGYIVQGYAESPNGRTGWSSHAVFAPPDARIFDFCVVEHGGEFHAIFSRIWLGPGEPPATTGLWWCRADAPAGSLASWRQPVQIMTAEDCGWHAGPWKPSFAFDGLTRGRACVFFDGMYQTNDPGPFPFVFTLGCLEIDLPL